MSLRVKLLPLAARSNSSARVIACLPGSQRIVVAHSQSKHASPRITLRLCPDGQSQPYINNIIWAGPATGAGLPATVAPIGRTESGLPIGVQIIGPYLEDSTPIQFAQLLEQAFGGFVPPVLEAGLEHRALPLLGPVVLGDRLLVLRSATRSWASPHDRSWRNKSVYLNR
jgi:hypothetical protein